MPLSEHEQRLLSEMESRLLAEDPRFASAMRRSATGGQPKQKLALGVLGVLVSLGAMLVSLYNGLVPFAVVGFVAMLGSAYWAISAPRKKGARAGAAQDGSAQQPPRGRHSGGQARRTGDAAPTDRNRGGFMQRMERRWERRRDTGNPDA